MRKLQQRFARIVLVASLLLTAAVGQTTQNIPEMLKGLQSPKWPERQSAFEKLSAIPGVLQSTEVRDALIALQEREDRLLVTDPAILGDLPIDEGYSDAYAPAVVEVNQIIAERFRDERAVSALAAAQYNPDSPFAGWLADQKGAVDRLLKIASSGPDMQAGSASFVLATMVDRDDRVGEKGVRDYKVLDSATRAQSLALIRRHAVASHPIEAGWAIQGLAIAGEAPDISLLNSIANRSAQDGRQDRAREAAAKLTAKLNKK